jgi:uncharacterized lipoprotein NlpE involved in copper resistance
LNYLLLIAIVVIAGCNENAAKEVAVTEAVKTDTVNSLTSQHTSSNSLDWDGTYLGVLPCADCKGIATEITLTKELTYSMKTSYLGKGDTAAVIKGNFTWNAAGNTITLSGLSFRPSQYFVGENNLTQLDMAGKKITGSLADKYLLKKQ